MPDLVARADAQLRSLAAQIDDEEALPEELRGVEAPAADTDADDSSTTDESSDESDEAAETAAPDDDDDDDDDGAEGLGAMFG
jgi:large subunit ribosomal protein L10